MIAVRTVIFLHHALTSLASYSNYAKKSQLYNYVCVQKIVRSSCAVLKVVNTSLLSRTMRTTKHMCMYVTYKKYFTR